MDRYRNGRVMICELCRDFCLTQNLQLPDLHDVRLVVRKPIFSEDFTP